VRHRDRRSPPSAQAGAHAIAGGVVALEGRRLAEHARGAQQPVGFVGSSQPSPRRCSVRSQIAAGRRRLVRAGLPLGHLNRLEVEPASDHLGFGSDLRLQTQQRNVTVARMAARHGTSAKWHYSRQTARRGFTTLTLPLLEALSCRQR
jgi:hypothetical protein